MKLRKTLKMQSSWPAGIAAERPDKISGGSFKVEVLDAANKKVIDGFYSIPYDWVNQNRAAVLFAGEEPVLQEGAGLAAPVGLGRRAGEGLHAAAVLVRGELLLAGGAEASGQEGR